MDRDSDHPRPRPRRKGSQRRCRREGRLIQNRRSYRRGIWGRMGGNSSPWPGAVEKDDVGKSYYICLRRL